MKKADLEHYQQKRLALIQRSVELNIDGQIKELQDLKETLFLPQNEQRHCYPAVEHLLRAYAGEGSQMGTPDAQTVGFKDSIERLVAMNISLMHLLSTYNALIGTLALPRKG